MHKTKFASTFSGFSRKILNKISRARVKSRDKINKSATKIFVSISPFAKLGLNIEIACSYFPILAKFLAIANKDFPFSCVRKFSRITKVHSKTAPLKSCVLAVSNVALKYSSASFSLCILTKFLPIPKNAPARVSATFIARKKCSQLKK